MNLHLVHWESGCEVVELMLMQWKWVWCDVSIMTTKLMALPCDWLKFYQFMQMLRKCERTDTHLKSYMRRLYFHVPKIIQFEGLRKILSFQAK
jgi:hypothetical protein